MNPERVIEEQADREALRAALQRFAFSVQAAAARRDAFISAGVVLLDLGFTDDTVTFADKLVAKLAGRPLPAKEYEAHPLLQLLGFFLRNGPAQYGFFEEDEELFNRVVEQGNYRSGAVRARAKVAKIEDELRAGIGTGVLVGQDLLLTCEHVLSKTRAKRAWAVFGNKQNWDGQTVSPGTRFELDLENPVSAGGGSEPDFVLLRIQKLPKRAGLRPDKRELNAGQTVCTIHHPGGTPAIVSDPGQIVQVGKDYIYHDLVTDEGSSGAPIFDDRWQLLALHQGITPATPPRLAAGVPLYAFWDAVAPHLTP